MSTLAERPAPPIGPNAAPGDRGSERLLHELEERARAEVAAVLAAGRDETERIRQEAAVRCATARDTVLRACDDEVAAAHAEALAAARVEARRAVLLAQHAVIARALASVRDLARVRACRRAAPDSVDISRLEEVLSYLGGEPAELVCAPRLAAPVAAALRGAAARVREDASIAVGLRAATLDGRVLVDDTLEGWLTREALRLAIEICRELGARP